MPEGVSGILVVAYAYLVGSIPTAYLLARWMKGIDLREYGSGNVGGANVAASIGKRYFVPVVLLDALVKGTASVLLAGLLGLGPGYQAVAGLAAVAGHNWPVYIRFTGGRGMATAVGVLLVLAPRELIAFAGVAIAGVALFRSTALWVGIASVLLPVWAWLLGESVEVLLFCLGLVALLALKRLEANRMRAPDGVPWHLLAARRLLFDRDVSTRDEWTRRQPRQQGEKGR